MKTVNALKKKMRKTRKMLFLTNIIKQKEA